MSEYESNFILKNYIKTFVTQLYVAISGVILVKIMAMVLSKEIMGLFIVLRRTVLFAFPLLAVNLNTALAKFASSDEKNTEGYTRLGLGVFLYSYVIVSVLVFAFRDRIAVVLFNDLKYKQLLFVLLPYLLCVAFYSFMVNFYRGQRKFKKMNAVSFFYWTVALIVVPLALVLGSGNDFKAVFTYFLAFSFFVMLVMLPWGIKLFLKRFSEKVDRDKRLDFLRYGIFRLPSSLFASGIFFLPVYVASKFYGLEAAAVVGLVVYLVQISHVFGASMGMLLLPEFSFRSSVYSGENLRSDLEKLFEFVMSAFIMMGVVLFLFSEELVMIMFGGLYVEYESLFGIGALITGFYLAYAVYRSVLDGLYIKPYSMFVNFAGTVAFVFFAFVLREFAISGVVISFAVAVLLASLMPIFILKVKTGVKLVKRKNLCILGWVGTVLVVFSVVKFIVAALPFWGSLTVKFFICIVILVGTLFLYKRLDLFWIDRVMRFRMAEG